MSRNVSSSWRLNGIMTECLIDGPHGSSGTTWQTS
jgi:hypothetical protein